MSFGRNTRDSLITARRNGENDKTFRKDDLAGFDCHLLNSIFANQGAALWIGAEPGGGYPFGGTGNITIDEVRISDIARSQEEIKLAMEKGYGQLAVYPSLKLSTAWGALK